MTFLTDLAEAWRPWAWGATWQLALLVALIAGLLLGARKMPPRLRYALWLLVTIKVFLPPSLGLVFGIGTWGIEPVRQRAVAWVGPADLGAGMPGEGARPVQPTGAAAMMADAHKTGSMDSLAPAPSISSAPSAPSILSISSISSIPSIQSIQPAQAQPSAPDNRTAASAARRIFSPRHLALAPFAVWILGVAGFAAFVLTRYARFSRQLRDAEEVTEGPLRIELERLAASLGKSYPPELLLSSAVSSPLLCGLFRPRIVLPANLPATLGPDDLSNVLLHELIHWRRRDVAVGWLQLAGQALFWFHPLVWLANARARHERECACDEAALAIGRCAPKAYGESLLKVLLASEGRSAAALGFLGIFERGTRIQNRLEAIMASTVRSRRGTLFGWLGLAVFAVVCLPMFPAAKATGQNPAGTALSVPAPSKDPLRIVIAKKQANESEERIYLKTSKAANERKVGLKELRDEAAKAKNANPDLKFVIEPDKDASADVTVKVLAALREAQIDNIGISVSPKSPTSSTVSVASTSSTSPQIAVTLSYVHDAAEGKRSLGASGHAVEFARPDKAHFVEAVRIYASRYGMPEAPQEDFHIYLLNAERQVLADLKYPYSTVERGDMKWVELRTPSIEVPERFLVALAFNPAQTKGIYLGLDETAEGGHSFTGLPDSGYEKWGAAGNPKEEGDWMVRVDLAEVPSGEKGTQRLADWKAPASTDPFAGCTDAKVDAGESDDKQSYGGSGPAIQLHLADFGLTPPASSASAAPPAPAAAGGGAAPVGIPAPPKAIASAGDNPRLVGLRLYAGRYGSGYDPERTDLKVSILDSANQVRWQGAFPYALFAYKSKWVDLVLKEPLAVRDLAGDDGVVTIALDPEATQTKGLYFHYNKNPQTSHSFAGTVARGFKPTPDREWIVRAFFQAAKPGSGETAAAPAGPAATVPASPATGAPPRIVSTTPAIGASDVDPATTEIAVTFDRDMDTSGYSWTGGGEYFPPSPGEAIRPSWRDKRTCVLPVKLEPGHFYRVGINSSSFENFSSAEGVPAPPSAIFFSTKGATDDVKALAQPPQIVKMEPANRATDVDPKTTELRVTFNVPMGGGNSWCGGGPTFPTIPEGKRASWSEDHKTAILPVALEPGKSYRLSLNAPSFNNFASAAGVAIDPVPYSFTTGN